MAGIPMAGQVMRGTWTQDLTPQPSRALPLQVKVPEPGPGLLQKLRIPPAASRQAYPEVTFHRWTGLERTSAHGVCVSEVLLEWGEGGLDREPEVM